MFLEPSLPNSTLMRRSLFGDPSLLGRQSLPFGLDVIWGMLLEVSWNRHPISLLVLRHPNNAEGKIRGTKSFGIERD